MLTDAALKCLKPKAKMYKVSDRDGMYVRVAPSGAISFRLDYRLNGRRETVYLGRYARDGISLARARELCIDARRAIAEGRSPAIEKQREKRRIKEAKSFGQFGEKWLINASMADSTRAMRRSIFERELMPCADPGLGVRLGGVIDPDDLGPVGVLYVKMRNLRDAITRFSRYFPALQSATHIAMREEGDTTWVEYQILDPSIWPRRHDSEFTMALLCTLTRSQLGRNWSPEEVHFEHAPPVNHREVSQFFRTVARFEQKTNRWWSASSIAI
jgi:hypothetical protein